MAHFRGGDRPFSSIHKIVKMLLSPHSSNKPASQDTTDMAEDVDEPPDHRFLPSSPMHGHDDDALVYVKSPSVPESLLTRALKNSPELSPTEPHPSYGHRVSFRSYPQSNVSGVSTAELTSDGGMTTSPSLSNTPSPPAPSHLTGRRPSMTTNKNAASDPSECTVEANLGRKRCISFACGRKAEGQQKPQQQQPQSSTPPKPIAQNKDSEPTPTEPVKRKTTLTFVCPSKNPEPARERSPVRKTAFRSRPRCSPAPIARRASQSEKEPSAPVAIPQAESTQELTPTDRRGVPTRGLGKFEESEATRFHEFASSVEEDDEWVAKAGDYTNKITLSDCMKKENAIRKLGEEAEQEALEDEDEFDDDDEDEDDDDDSADEDDDASTVNDSDTDDGNESDNEAGFADSDDSDAGSDYEFWAPSTTTAATSPQTIDIPRQSLDRRVSNASYDSPFDNEKRNWPPALTGKPGRRSSKTPRMRPGTPNLPDSTDFVCGTLDEDRPLEAAYKSCMEQRRLSKQVVIPQDIDPSFPTSDPEDQDEDEEDEVEESVVDEAPRGRSSAAQSQRTSPRLSPSKRMVSPPPKRMVSPPPPRQGRSSPKRLRSPPPPAMKLKLPSPIDRRPSEEVPVMHPQGVNISELVQRPSVTRTKSLPRTPNPFFASLEEWRPRWTGIDDSSDHEGSRTREVHTRGPIDIVEGLEKKRQKRKEKFWRQHCRRAAKEQMVRRPIPGKGAERMKELGLEVAERCRAYGVGENAQLVLSV